MKKVLLFMTSLLTTLMLSAQSGNTTTKVVSNDGTLIEAPVFGSAAADLIHPRKCGNVMTDAQTTRAIATVTPCYTPHTGSPLIMVILAEFQDKKFTMKNVKAAFRQLWNSKETQVNMGNENHRNYGSVAQYFSTMSSGTFTPSFDVYGPVTLPDTMGYYGGKNPNSSSDERSGQLVLDAIAQLTDSIADVSVYDSNSDGYIDCVYVIYAGLGQNYGGAANTVWAKASTVSGTFKGKKLGRFAMSAEHLPYKVDESSDYVISGVGVPCHEFSHCLGLPDIYPTVNSAQQSNNQEMEYWDLMDGGTYVYNSCCPAPYTAWEKQQMEWAADVKNITASGSYTMATSTEKGGTAYKMVNGDDAKQYFMLENITKTGWNSQMPWAGLLVYRVVETGDDILVGTQLNNEVGKPRMAVVPADGACLSSYIKANESNYFESMRGDVFPGKTGVTQLNDNMNLPNFAFYSDYTNNITVKVNQALDNIAMSSSGVITFDYIADYATGIQGILEDVVPADGRIYTLDGRYVGTSIDSLPHGIYIRGGKKFVK